jgi:uncharacterized protein
MSEPAFAPSRLPDLRQHLRKLGSVLVCYSGGIDSALLLAVATAELPKGKAVGLTAISPSLARSERDSAEKLAQQFGADLRFVETHEMLRPEYARNEADRCFHCKTELYGIAAAKQQEWQLEHILNGANVDDLGDYRPGMDAARQREIKMPFIELGFGKSDIRAAAKEFGLPIWDKPASACLASRLPYGVTVTPERLAQVESMETGLKALGFRQVRVRWHERIARIEVPIEEIPSLLVEEKRAAIVELGKASGFSYITVDLAGYRMGSHNEVLFGNRLKLAT